MSDARVERIAKRWAATVAATQATVAAVVSDEGTDPELVAEVSAMFNDWRTSTVYRAGVVVADDGTLWRCVQAHTSQDDWRPSGTPALWAAVRKTAGPTVDEWRQPVGAHDAYKVGDRVTHNGQMWESTAAENVWEPGVYGWEVDHLTKEVGALRHQVRELGGPLTGEKER